MLKTSTVLGVLTVLAVVLVLALASVPSVGYAGDIILPTPLPSGHRDLCTGAGLLSSDEVASLPPATIGKACAALKICSEGDQVVKFSDIPNCPHNLTVLCLNDQGQWVKNTVHNVSTSPDGTSLMFTSDQRGTCGFFPAGSSLMSAVIAP